MGNQEIRYRLSATRKGQQFPTSSCQEFLSHWNLGLTCRGVGEKGRKAKEGGERGFLPFFTNTTPRRCRSLLPPCVIVCAHMPPTSSVPSPAPTVSSWHWCLVLYFSFFSLFVFFSLSPPVFWKAADERFAGSERGTSNCGGDPPARLVIPLMHRESLLLIVLRQVVFQADRQG